MSDNILQFNPLQRIDQDIWQRFAAETEVADIDDLEAAITALETMCWVEIGRAHDSEQYCARLVGLPFEYPTVYRASTRSRGEAAWLCCFDLWQYERQRDNADDVPHM